jgi:hypothetical protein
VSHALCTTPLCSHESLVPGMCRCGRDNLVTGQVTLHSYTSQDTTHAVLTKSLFKPASPGNTYWAALLLTNSLHKRVGQPSHQAKNQNCLSGASCCPFPISTGCRPSLSPPPLTTLRFSLWDKFHRKRPRFWRLVLADRPHSATACCDPNVSHNKEIAINTYLVYIELCYGRTNVFELRIHLLNTNT